MTGLRFGMGFTPPTGGGVAPDPGAALIAWDNDAANDNLLQWDDASGNSQYLEWDV
jgi:hypothetical protein